MSGIPGVDMFPEERPGPWHRDPLTVLLMCEALQREIRRWEYELEFVWHSSVDRAATERAIRFYSVVLDVCLKNVGTAPQTGNP